MSSPGQILVIRNDKLGDFMLAWPAFALLKNQYPVTRIAALVPPYTAPVAELCPSIDEIIIDDEHRSVLADARHLAQKINHADIDASIAFYSELRTAMALWLAGVAVRVAPATKLAQLFQNKRLSQKRSSSAKPEYVYNVELARYMIQINGGIPLPCPPPPYLEFERSIIAQQRASYCEQNGINPDKRLVFVHAGSGGSAVNLSLEQYAVIASYIIKHSCAHVVLTAGPDELEYAKQLAAMLTAGDTSIYHSTHGLVTFTQFISTCDAFISGSTGPLHIAGALNRPTIGFYPARRSATSTRWQTLSQADRRLAFSPRQYSGDTDHLDINISECIKDIDTFLKSQRWSTHP